MLGALFGRTSPTKIGRAVSKGSKILKERGELSRAEERMLAVQEDIEDLEESGIEGVILGKAIYEGKISLAALESFILNRN